MCAPLAASVVHSSRLHRPDTGTSRSGPLALSSLLQPHNAFGQDVSIFEERKITPSASHPAANSTSAESGNCILYPKEHATVGQLACAPLPPSLSPIISCLGFQGTRPPPPLSLPPVCLPTSFASPASCSPASQPQPPSSCCNRTKSLGRPKDAKSRHQDDDCIKRRRHQARHVQFVVAVRRGRRCAPGRRSW